MSAIAVAARNGGILALGLALAVTLTACPKKEAGVTPGGAQPFVRLAPPPQSAQQIRDLMMEARESGDPTTALERLNELAASSPPPLNEEAMFRRVELMLEFQYPEAESEARQLLASHPYHALAPYARYWLAKWYLDTQQERQALNELSLLLQHPRLTLELLSQALEAGTPLAQNASEAVAIDWYLAAAAVDPGRMDHWLRMAANRASLESIKRLLGEKRLQNPPLSDFYLYAARIRLMDGKMDELQAIAALLTSEMADSPLTRKVQGWASGETQEMTIGVMLPLTGRYAPYGQEALRGIRLAVASETQGSTIMLRIEDTGETPQGAVRAYKELASSDVDWVLGPLLADHTEALLPYLKPNLPVMSLTSQASLAEASKALFVHSLARTTQASFMAEHAWQQEARRAVVISASDAGETEEAEAFASTFKALGGELVSHVKLDDSIDHRPQLNLLREESDNEELLAELDEDLALLSPEPDLDIRMPVNFDVVYLALTGKEVAALAGQLAYVGITDTPLYGSSRWHDGHLLDDRGRDLSTARFANITFLEGSGPTPDSIRLAYREAWGSGNPGVLFGIAYDSVTIASVLGSRLGLHGKDAIRALHDVEGFPGVTGHVRFDNNGVGRKSFELFRVLRNRIVPAG